MSQERNKSKLQGICNRNVSGKVEFVARVQPNINGKARQGSPDTEGNRKKPLADSLILELEITPLVVFTIIGCVSSTNSLFLFAYNLFNP